jgi:hypothetical protein
LPYDAKPAFIGSFLTLQEGDIVDSAETAEDRIRLRIQPAIAAAEPEVDTIAPNRVELHWRLWLRCPHSIMPEGRLGAGMRSLGLAASAIAWSGGSERLLLRLQHRGELGIGWEAALDAELPLGELLDAEVQALLHRFRTMYRLRLGSLPSRYPFRRWNGGAEWTSAGRTWWDFRTDSVRAYTRREHLLRTWLSWGTQRRDQLFITLSALWRQATAEPEYRRAFDNTVLLVLGVSSLAQRYRQTASPFVSGDSVQLVTGAWGAVSLGLSIPTSAGGDRSSYLAGELEQSAVGQHFLLAGRIAAGNAFTRGIARYTLFELSSSGWLFLPASLALLWNGWHQNVWNWPAYRAERLDVFTGFPAPFPSRAADNVQQLRIELRRRGWRLTPDFAWGVALFHCLGSLWNQGTPLARTSFTNATGLSLSLFVGGVRLRPWQLTAELAYHYSSRRVLPVLRAEFGYPVLFHRYRFPEPLGQAPSAEP